MSKQNDTALTLQCTQHVARLLGPSKASAPVLPHASLQEQLIQPQAAELQQDTLRHSMVLGPAQDTTLSSIACVCCERLSEDGKDINTAH